MTVELRSATVQLIKLQSSFVRFHHDCYTIVISDFLATD